MASFSDEQVGSAHRPVLEWPEGAPEALRKLAAPRYVAAAAAAVPLIGLALLRLGAGAEFAVAAFVIAVLCVLTAIDITERRIPNRIVLPSFVVVLLAQIALFPDRALEWILAAVAGAVVLLLPLLVFRSGVGMGDVKLMLLLGAALGGAVATALVVGSLAAAVYAGVLLARGGPEARHTAFPFGPFLTLGALVALLA